MVLIQLSCHHRFLISKWCVNPVPLAMSIQVSNSGFCDRSVLAASLWFCLGWIQWASFWLENMGYRNQNFHYLTSIQSLQSQSKMATFWSFFNIFDDFRSDPGRKCQNFGDLLSFLMIFEAILVENVKILIVFGNFYNFLWFSMQSWSKMSTFWYFLSFLMTFDAILVKNVKILVILVHCLSFLMIFYAILVENVKILVPMHVDLAKPERGWHPAMVHF